MCWIRPAPSLGSIDYTSDRSGAIVPTRPLDIAVSAYTSASPEQVLAAARDFSERRPKLWPNVKAKHFVVHDEGEEFADVTEGIWITGLFWERSRYDWSEPGAVTATVTDSNVRVAGRGWSRSELPRSRLRRSRERLHQPQHDLPGVEPHASRADDQGRGRDSGPWQPEEPVGRRLSLRLRQPDYR